MAREFTDQKQQPGQRQLRKAYLREQTAGQRKQRSAFGAGRIIFDVAVARINEPPHSVSVYIVEPQLKRDLTGQAQPAISFTMAARTRQQRCFLTLHCDAADPYKQLS
jgi:hypothetical protein